jgi:hypothetical protein
MSTSSVQPTDSAILAAPTLTAGYPLDSARCTGENSADPDSRTASIADGGNELRTV